MEPVATILWGLAWLFIGGGISVFIAFVGAIGAAAMEKVWPLFTGWVLSVAWAFFVAVQVILHIYYLIQQATGNA